MVNIKSPNEANYKIHITGTNLKCQPDPS